jgi:hypothetical protein
MNKVNIGVTKPISKLAGFQQAMQKISQMEALVGIPADNTARSAIMVGIAEGTDRSGQLMGMAGKIDLKPKPKKVVKRDKAGNVINVSYKTVAPSKATVQRVAKLMKAAQGDVNNAELLFIHSKGSPIRHIPPRPVLEPAIAAEDNLKKITYQLVEADKAALAGNMALARQRVGKAGLAGQNAARGWFTDPRNAWAPNRPATIRHKGSDRPLIDTGALRAAITYVVR